MPAAAKTGPAASAPVQPSQRMAGTAAAHVASLHSPSASPVGPPQPLSFAAAPQMHAPSSLPGYSRTHESVSHAQPEHATAAQQASAMQAGQQQVPDGQTGAQTDRQHTDPGQQQPAGEAVGSGGATTAVAEMLRTERWSDVDFQAAQAAEMELRDAVIKQQQGEAQRMKKQRREAHQRNEAVARQQEVQCCMLMPDAHARCSGLMRMPDAHAQCSCLIHMPDTHARCTCLMHMTDAHA